MGARAVTGAQPSVHITNGTLPSQLPNDEQKGSLRYVLGITCVVGLLFALYHASSTQKGAPSTLAGILAPAAIMVSYLVWVLYSARANRQRAARLAALTLHNNTMAEAGQRSVPRTSITITSDTPSRSPNTRDSGESPKKLTSVPRRVRNSPLHQSTDNLARTTTRAYPDRPYNTLEVTTPGVHQLGRAGKQGLGRSSQQLNNARQIAAVVANLPSYSDATNRNNWTLDKNHSRETLLRNNK